MSKLLLVLFLLLGVGLSDSHAYVRTTSASGAPAFWREAEAPLNILVGCPPGACFADAARAAAEAWNAAGAQFTFRVGAPTPNIPIACEARPAHINGLVTIFWSSDQDCSPSLGADTIALTHLWTAGDGHVGDADIEFNDIHFRWSVYDGPSQPAAYDFQRTALHELGHVVGLDHPDDHGQRVPAIMNSHDGDIDRLQPDDVAGIRAIYGRSLATITKGALENPGPDTAKTGVGIISGWVCDADIVQVALGGWRATVAYKMSRRDTEPVCGDADNGFVLLVNWNLLGEGTHQVRLFADGQELVSHSVTVKTFGTEFLTGQEAYWKLEDWPAAGTDTIIGWTEALQNIEIVEIVP